MMNCPSCGNQVHAGDSFCMHCGAFLTDSAKAAGGPSALPPQAEPAPPSLQQEITAKTAGEGEWAVPASRRASSGGRWIGLAALLLVLFGLAAAGGYFLQRTIFRWDQAEDTAPRAQAEETPADAALPQTEPETQPPVIAASPSEVASSEIPAAEWAPVEAKAAQASSGASENRPGEEAPKPAARRNTTASAGQKPEAPVFPNLQAVETKPEPQPAQATDPTPALPSAGQAAQQPGPAAAEAQLPAGRPGADGADAETPQGRRAPRNTRVLKPDGGPAPPAHPPAPEPALPKAGGLQPRAPAASPQLGEEGIIYWTGRLAKNQVIVIERGKATIGTADGILPATPVDVWLPSPAVVLVDRPNDQNNWNRVAFRCLQSTNRNVTLNIQWKRLR
jgi:hypothetical protein